MSGICLPIDASAGTPSFPAAQHRAAQSVLMSPTSGRPLGARSGIRPGATPNVSLAGSVWTLTPFSAVADPGTGLAVGPYLVAFLANETGTLNVADGTNPRIDRLDVQVPDDPPGASPRSAVIVYTAGVAAASPSAPAAPARSFPLGTFTVPKSGAGSPSWSPAFRLTVSAGGIIPAGSSADYPSAPYVGQYVDDATLGLLRWNGSAWVQMGLGARLQYRHNNAQALTTNGYIPLTGWTADLDNLPGFNATTGVFTVQAGWAGNYEIDVMVGIVSSTTQGTAGLAINGANVVTVREAVTSSSTHMIIPTYEAQLAVGNTVMVQAFGATGMVAANGTYASMLRIRKVG